MEKQISLELVMKDLDFSQEWFDINEDDIWQMEQAIKYAKPGDTHVAYCGTNIVQLNELICMSINYRELRYLKGKLLELINTKTKMEL